VNTRCDEIVTDVLLAVFALEAGSTTPDRDSDDSIPLFERLDSLSDSLNGPTELMTECHWSRHPIITFPSVDMSISATDTCSSDVHEHLVSVRRRTLDLHSFDGSRFGSEFPNCVH
jgi:hypothetical protein